MKDCETKIINYTDSATGARVVKVLTEHDGKIIRACSKCHPDDEFNLELGTEIALKRLNIKIAEKRCAYSVNYAKQCKQYLDYLDREKRRIKKSMERAEVAAFDRKVEVQELKAELKSILEKI